MTALVFIYTALENPVSLSEKGPIGNSEPTLYKYNRQLMDKTETVSKIFDINDFLSWLITLEDRL
jgi:hypothetical protein